MLAVLVEMPLTPLPGAEHCCSHHYLHRPRSSSSASLYLLFGPVPSQPKLYIDISTTASFPVTSGRNWPATPQMPRPAALPPTARAQPRALEFSPQTADHKDRNFSQEMLRCSWILRPPTGHLAKNILHIGRKGFLPWTPKKWCGALSSDSIQNPNAFFSALVENNKHRSCDLWLPRCRFETTNTSYNRHPNLYIAN